MRIATLKTKVFHLLLVVLITNNLIAQNTTNCNGSRYQDKIFSSTTKTNVKYGENLNQGVMEELLMSVYTPDGDEVTKRPLVIFAHGGFFQSGNKGEFADLCIEYASRGYVAATIDYRKFAPGTELDHLLLLEGLVKGIQDMKAAIRYFRHDCHTDNIFRIDPDYIIVGGYSYGSMIALHTAYMDETEFSSPIFDRAGGIEGTSNDYLNESSEVQGVINHSGALLSNEFIQAGEPALISRHGGLDVNIPSGNGFLKEKVTHKEIIRVHGSEMLNAKTSSLNIPNQLHLSPTGNHCCIYGGEEYNNYVLSNMSFWKEQLCLQTTSVSFNSLVRTDIELFPNPVTDVLQIQFEGIHALQLSLYNNMGKLVGNWEGLQTNTNIPIHHLENGMYFYQLTIPTSDGFQSGKIIKQ